jgi:hypothetical protein
VSGAALLALLAAAAQEPVLPAAADTCTTGRVAEVRIDNTSIFDPEEESESRFEWAYRAANALHFRTRSWVIRRELLMGRGDCYDAFLVEETERLLRNYSFLARARVEGVRQPDGDWVVEVETHDEWSTTMDVRIGTNDGLKLEGFSLGEDNLLGTGNRLSGFWLERRVTREYGGAFHAPQLFRSRWDFTIEAGRTRPGTFVRQEVAYPFVGEVSEWAGRQRYVRSDRLFDYVTRSAGDDHVLLPDRPRGLAGPARCGADVPGAGLSGRNRAGAGRAIRGSGASGQRGGGAGGGAGERAEQHPRVAAAGPSQHLVGETAGAEQHAG